MDCKIGQQAEESKLFKIRSRAKGAHDPLHLKQGDHTFPYDYKILIGGM